MAGLLDIAPLTRTVTVRGNKLTVYPFSLGDIAHLVHSFGGLEGLVRGENFVAALSAAGDDALAKAICAVLRETGEPDLAAAKRLSAAEQAAILAAAVEMTFPRDDQEMGEFVAQVLAVALRVAVVGESLRRICAGNTIPEGGRGTSPEAMPDGPS